MEAKGSFWNYPQSDGVLISDLSCCEPQSAISSKIKEDCWHKIPYETAGGISGVMLAKGEMVHPPEVSLALEAKGWHAIYLAVFRGQTDVGLSQIRVKLNDERLFDKLLPSFNSYQRMPNGAVVKVAPAPGSTRGLEEFFWKAADLDGQRLLISHLNTSQRTAAQLAFVRLVPMSEDEVAEYRGAAGREDTMVLAAEMDGQQPYYDGARTVEDIQEYFEPLRGTDIGKLFLGAAGIGGGQMLYPSKAGVMYGSEGEEFSTEPAHRTVGSLRGFVSRGIDPLKVTVDHVHSMGIDVYLGFRMGTMASIPPSWLGPVAFWKEHPEWRCRDREGKTIARLSLAYPEVRRFYIELFEEMLGYGVAGVQPIYTRRPPSVLFEPPVVEDFKKEHGFDPRELPDDPKGGWGHYTSDERLERLWAGYVTTFMRELRQALDRHRRPDGGRVEVVACVGNDADYNRAGGLDIGAWAREGLVDILVPYTGGDGGWLVDYEYYRKVTGGTSCVFYEDITPRAMPGGAYARRALTAYEGGAAGLSFWDSCNRIATKSQWHTIRRLGHREGLEQMAEQPDEYLVHPLRRIYDWHPGPRY